MCIAHGLVMQVTLDGDSLHPLVLWLFRRQDEVLRCSLDASKDEKMSDILLVLDH